MSADGMDNLLRKIKHNLPLSIAETAELLGMDRNTVSTHLRVVPVGDAAVARPGEIPCRVFGRRKFIFPDDLRSTAADVEAGQASIALALAGFGGGLLGQVGAALARISQLEARTATACECGMRGGAFGVRVPAGSVACPSDRVPGDALCPRDCECGGRGFKRCTVCNGTGAVIVGPAGEGST